MSQNFTSRPAESTDLTGRSFLSAYLKAQQTALFTSVLTGVTATAALITQWLSFAYIAHQVIVNKTSFSEHTAIVILLFVSLISRALLLRLKRYFAQRASLHIRSDIRRDILRQWRNMSPLSLQQKSAGASATQWVEEVESMDAYFSRYWPQQALALFSPLLILIVVAYLNWFCALLLLISAPLVPLFMMLIGMKAEQINQGYSSAKQRLAGHFFDRVAKLSTIKMLGAEQTVFQEVEARSKRYREVLMKTLRVAFLSSSVLEFFTSVAIASLAIYIGFSLYGAIGWGPAESLSLFTGLSILLLAPEFFQPLRLLSQYYHDRAAALGAANNLVNLFNIPSTQSCVNKDIDRADDTRNGALANYGYRISAENISIAYDARAPIIDNLSFELQGKQTLVISGQSGSGKSSLLNAIAGYLPLFNGQLMFANAQSNHPQRPTFSYLPQKAWIKNASIYDNLRVFAPNASQEQMHTVLKSLGLDDELSLSRQGLHTLLGEHGQGLSGGQMQRVALARVLLNPSDIVLLDEPSAQLDIRSKRFVIEAIKRLQRYSTLVIATHDPELIAVASQHIKLAHSAAKKADNATLV